MQNLCLRNKELCPHTDAATLRRLHVEPDVGRKRSFHVDGDVLVALLEEAELGAEECLRGMLAGRPEEREDGSVDFDSAAKRTERFGEVVRACLGGDGGRAEGEGEGEAEAEDAVIRAVKWMRIVLAPVL